MAGGVAGTTLIMGLGNVLLGDDGFGVHVIRHLKEARLPDNIRLIEGGVGGFNLLGHLEGVQRLVIVDAMIVDLTLGEVCLFQPGERLKEPGKKMLAYHQLGVLELIQMGKLIGYEPVTFFLVTRPQQLDWSLELSPAVQGAAAKAVSLVQKMCRPPIPA